MAKADDEIKELQRRLRHLARLEGVVVRTADGPVLLRPTGIDPFKLSDACRAGRPGLTALLAAVRCEDPPQRLTPALLARAHRDLRALDALPWLAIVRAAPRHFRNFHNSRSMGGALDERWLAAREARIQALAGALQPEAIPPADPVHDLVADLHGPDAAATLTDWLARSAGLGERRRREAGRRIDGLVRRLLDPAPGLRESPALATMLDAAAAELLRLTQIPGRAAARRLEPLLRRVLAWPRPPNHAAPADAHSPVPEDSRDAPVPEDSRNPPVPAAIRNPPVPRDTSLHAREALAARVRELGAALVHALGTTRGASQLTALRRVLGLHALAFPVDPADAAPPALGPDELELAESRLRALISAPTPRLSLARALWLLRLPVAPAICATLAPWVADGLAPAIVDLVIALGLHERLTALTGDVALAAAYADWLVRLVPHYRRLGLEVDLRPQHFARLHATHRGGLALLAHCLIEHHAPDERGADAQLARLRATLGLFAARPRRAEALLAELTHAPPGAGHHHFPEFATWLGDAALLDRFCHLCVLADEPLALSTTLRRDFDRHDRLLRQREHLAALPSLTPTLRTRLTRLDAELAQALPGDRGWTLRRLAERCEALQARAFASKLDLLIRELLHEAIGVAPPTLTPAWRDALRFYLGAADRNRALLGLLLRFAAAHPGQPIAPTLPRNTAWLGRASARMRTDAWLAPQLRTLEFAGARHTLCIEHDPLEVLRMGIPFGTCLSLGTGFNADSTVLNAVDINKRVLYLRDARGSVIARQLIAVSSDFGLLGYRLYCAHKLDDRPEIAAAFQALCRELADACGLPLADDGEPEAIHPGFWYDDGCTSWARRSAAVADLAPYFALLGRPVPDQLSSWSLGRARAWLAVARGEPEAGLAMLPDIRDNAAAAALHTMIAAQLGPRELARRARREPACAKVHVAMQLRQSPAAALRAASSLAYDRELWSDLDDLFDHSPPSAELARAWLDAAMHERRHAQVFDDHGLAHRTVYIGESLACLPVAEIVARCRDLAALWDWIVAEQDQCSHCRESGVEGLRRALLTAHARAPDPEAILAALRGRHGPLAQDAALHVASRFSLAARPCALGHGLGASWLTRLTQRPLPAPRALRALRELLRARPELGDTPEMFAALVRQAGPHARHEQLPTPTEPPFAALGELLLHLPDLAHLLAPWQDPDVAPAKWQPDPCELHFHRTVATPWRRHLARRSNAEDSHEARMWLARLGDVEALARGERRGQIALAHEMRRQHALRDRPADGPCDMSLLTAATTARADLRTTDPHTLDLALLREAARALEAPHDLEALVPAITLLRAADLPADVWHDIIDRLLGPAGPPAPDLVPLLCTLLELPAVRVLPTQQLARLAAAPALHPPLVEHLERSLRAYHVTLHAQYSQLERAPGLDPAHRDALLGAWISRTDHEAADISTPFGCAEETRFTACVPVWLRAAPPMWLAVYRELRDLDYQSRFLDALLALPPERAEDLTELRRLAGEWQPHGEDEQAAHQWLLTELPPPPAELSPQMSQETSSESPAPARS